MCTILVHMVAITTRAKQYADFESMRATIFISNDAFLPLPISNKIVNASLLISVEVKKQKGSLRFQGKQPV